MSLPILQPGDHLLYGGSSWIDIGIKIKTWGPCAHCECYIGNGESVASRNGIGVNVYPLRVMDLLYVLRPNKPFDLKAAMVWFETVRGEKYDWKGLLCFWLAVKQGSQKKMFCSETLTRFGRAGGLLAFNPRYDADRVAPNTFLTSNVFDWIEC